MSRSGTRHHLCLDDMAPEGPRVLWETLGLDEHDDFGRCLGEFPKASLYPIGFPTNITNTYSRLCGKGPAKPLCHKMHATQTYSRSLGA